MKKFINNPEEVVDEMLEGLLLAHSDKIKSVGEEDNHSLVKIDAPSNGKVAIVTGGGSGHLPLFLGYVGNGMLDGVAVGDIFASPSVQQILDVTKKVDGGKGVLYLYGNYGGDVMNFDMAAEMSELEDIDVDSVIGTDDVASMPKGSEDNRRGVAGLFYLYKIAAAKAETGADLKQVKEVAEKVNSRVRTIGVAVSPCTIPSVGKPNFEIEEGSMEVGMGIHGEPGMYSEKIASADEVADLLTNLILKDIDINENDSVSILVNGLGSTPLEELYIVYRKVHKNLSGKNINIYKSYVGEYATSMEMGGLSISILKLDKELKDILDTPFDTPFHKQF